MIRALLAAALLLGGASLAACGQKGPLKLPEKDPAAAESRAEKR